MGDLVKPVEVFYDYVFHPSTDAPGNQSSMNPAIHLHSLRDPCSPLDYVENITIDGHSIKIRGLGDFKGCKRALLPLVQNPGAGSGGKERGGSGSQTPCTEANCSVSIIPSFQRSEYVFQQ